MLTKHNLHDFFRHRIKIAHALLGVLPVLDLLLDFHLHFSLLHHVAQIQLAAKRLHTLRILVEQRVRPLDALFALRGLEGGLMHASERTLNVERTLRAYLGALTLTGSPELRWPRDARKAPATPWIRVSFDFPGGDPEGDVEGDKATKGALAVVLDLFWPLLKDVASGNIDDPAVVRDELLAAFRQKLIDLKDYSATPAS